MERETWKPIHQERIKNGHLRSWSLYAVQFPYGTETAYNYVTVNVHRSLADLEQDLGDAVSKAHPNMTPEAIFARTIEARQMVRGEVWRRIDHIE